MAEVTSDRVDPVIQDEIGLFSGKLRLVVGGVVLVGALLYFAFMAFQGATVYYYTPSEIMDLGPTPDGKMVRVSGKLVPSSFNRGEGSTVAEFELTDGIEQISASHDGVLPDLFFNDHSEIILEGTLGGDGVFASQNVIVKCPSKYIGEDGPLPEDHIDEGPTG